MVTLKFGLEVTQDHSNWYHTKAWVHQFRDKAICWVENRDFFFIPLAFDDPIRGVPIGIFPSSSFNLL